VYVRRRRRNTVLYTDCLSMLVCSSTLSASDTLLHYINDVLNYITYRRNRMLMIDLELYMNNTISLNTRIMKKMEEMKKEKEKKYKKEG
jgi:hypothetical protein